MSNKPEDTRLLDEMVEIDDSALERVGGGILGTALTFQIVSAAEPAVAAAAPTLITLYVGARDFLRGLAAA